ncbi:hypothetical protein AAG570_002367 [Ranatra chinensis]|uniref:Uncharacterized protein n=1 Tax=Ranatra chinensis TaxID=642074 RepID=A0ABD0Y7A7_9HEMI
MGPKSAANKAKSPPEPPKPDFKPVEIRFIQPDTAVIALESAEPIVQYEALYALNYFAESYDQELVESVTRLINGGEAGVSSGGMVEAAWSLVESTCQEVTASVYRLLANLFDRYGEAVRPILIRPRPLDLDDSGQDDGEDITYDVPNPFAIRAFDHYAAENCGISLQEMASRLLARLTRDQHPICNDLCQFCDVNKCFSRLRSTDPDVQLNTLKIISNIAKSGECVNSVVNVPDFSFVPMLDLMRSDYTQVQYLAVDVVSWFLALPSTEMTLHVIFRAEDGVKKFMEILEIFEWQDMHSKIFAALIKIAKLYPGPTSRGLQQVNGIEALVDYMENIDDDNLIENGLELLLRLAEDPCSTNVVCGEARTRVRDRMRTLLMEGTKEMVDMSCRVLGYVWNDGDPVDAEALDKIVSMASDPEGSWESRAAPLCTLLSAIRNSPSFAAHLVDINQIDSYKRYVNETPRVAPLEYTKIIVLVLTALVLQESTRKKVMNSDLIGTFVRCCQAFFPKDENNELAILGAEGLRASLEAGRPPHHWLLPLRIVFRLNCPTFLVHRIYAQLTKDPFNRSLEVVDVMANVIIMLLQDTAEARMLSTTLDAVTLFVGMITLKMWTENIRAIKICLIKLMSEGLQKDGKLHVAISVVSCFLVVQYRVVL